MTGLNETIAVLHAGESVEFTTTYTVTAEDVAAGSVVNVATATADPIDDPKDPDDEPTPPNGEGEEEVPTNSDLTLLIRYWVNATEAFPDFYAVYPYGDFYYVVSPTLPGYTPTLAVVEGNLYENTVVDVYYYANELTLTIQYRYLDGSEAAPTVEMRLYPGDPYDVTSPVIPGYVATNPRVQGTMGVRNETITVFYINEGIDIPDYGTPLGLGNVSLNAGECIE